LHQGSEATGEQIGADQERYVFRRQFQRPADDQGNRDRASIHHQHMLQAERQQARGRQYFVDRMNGGLMRGFLLCGARLARLYRTNTRLMPSSLVSRNRLARWHKRCSLSGGNGDRKSSSPAKITGGSCVPLIKNRYGKGRVRVMRIHRDGDRHEVSQLNVKAMIEGDFARTYTHADNSTSVSTDTIKNVVNIVARENTGLCTEEFCQVLAKKYLDSYPQVASVAITAHETKWSRFELWGQTASAQFCARQQRQAVCRSGRDPRGARRSSRGSMALPS